MELVFKVTLELFTAWVVGYLVAEYYYGRYYDEEDDK